MARFPQGQAVRLGGGGLPIQVKDSTGTLTNASATLVTLQKPDASTVTYSSPATDGTGLYHLDITQSDLSQNGHYQWVWDATVAGSHAITTGAFDVYDPLEVTVLSLFDAKDALNIPQATTTYDDEIRRMIATIEASLERITGGPIITRSVTERVDMDGSPWEIKLLKRPLVAVTSITDVLTGLTLDISALDVDTNASMVRRKDTQQFVATTGVVTVVYTAGQGTAVPPAIGSAAALILQHLWETQRGGSSTPRYGGTEETQMLGVGYAIPNQAAELLAPYARSSSG